MIEQYLDILILTIAFCMSVMVIRSKSLLNTVIMATAFSMLCAFTYLLMKAPDVALTEAAVGACATTCILLAVLRLLPKDTQLHKWRFVSLIIFVILFMILSYFTISIHPYGDINAITNKGPVEYYKKSASNDTGLLSLVNAILASYRGFDTFGEIVVIFAAGLCVILILGTKNSNTKDET